MTVALASDGRITLQGSCPVEDAEVLLQLLLVTPNATVDWGGCEWAHTAILQILLVAKTIPVGTPTSKFLREYVGPVLRRSSSPETK